MAGYCGVEPWEIPYLRERARRESERMDRVIKAMHDLLDAFSSACGNSRQPAKVKDVMQHMHAISSGKHDEAIVQEAIREAIWRGFLRQEGDKFYAGAGAQKL